MVSSWSHQQVASLLLFDPLFEVFAELHWLEADQGVNGNVVKHIL